MSFVGSDAAIADITMKCASFLPTSLHPVMYKLLVGILGRSQPQTGPSINEHHQNTWEAFAHVMLKERSHGEAVEPYRVRMSDNIQHLEQILQRARRLYNVNANLLSLPDELLTEILLYVRDAVPEGASDNEVMIPESSWYNSVMICRRLRQVILNSASLHTQLSTSTRSLENVRRGLVLSKALPICLFVQYPSKHQGLYDDIQLHGHRIRSLSLVLNRACSSDVPAWVYHMPSLVTLELRAFFPEIISSNEAVRMPSHASRATPTHIKLDAARISYHSHSVFHTVRTLSLMNVKFNIQEGDELKSLFEHCVVLEELTIKNSRVNLDHFDFEDPVLPPSLRKLTYSGAQEDHFEIISILPPSPRVAFAFTCTAPPHENVYWAFCHGVLHQWLGGEIAPEVAAVSLRPNTIALDIRLNFWRRAESSLAGHDPDVVYHGYADDKTGLRDILDGPDYSHVRHLTMDIDVDEYRFFFSLWVYKQMNDYPMPHLQSLTLRLSCDESDVGIFKRSWKLGHDASTLHEWLRLRSNAGQAIETLAVSSDIAESLDRTSGGGRMGKVYTPNIEGLEATVLPKVLPSWRDLVSVVKVVTD